jgi:uncharacterized protein (TIGR03435 family)
MRRIGIRAAPAILYAGLVVAPPAIAAPESAPMFTRFETVSIEPSHSTSGAYSGKVEARADQPVKLTLRNVSLKFCIQQAYSVKEYQIAGPGWIKNTTYNITATLAPGTSPDRVWPALRILLVERFKVSIRRETKELPIYALTIAKDGPKLQASADDDVGHLGFQPASPYGMPFRSGENASGTLRLTKTSMEEFCGNLSRTTNRPVLDRTGIAGTFDFALRYGRRGDTSEPSIFTAVQRQLGLKLQPDKGAIDMLIVESALKKPIAP